MQSGSMGDEDSAEWNVLRREAEVSVGSTRMLLTEMGQLNESFGEKLETYKQRTEEFSEEMAYQITLREREKDLMTNELRASAEARKQLAEIRNGIRVFIETEKGIMTKELKSFREAVTQHLQEMNELRETEKGIMTKELKSFREAVTQHLQEMNEMRASRGRERELPTNELKTSRKGRRYFSQNKSERRASSSNKFDEPDASRSTLFRKFKGLFGSSKSTRQRRRSLRKTQKKHKVINEASLRMPLLASQSHEDQLEYVQEHDKITDSLEISGSNEVESGSTASSGRCEAGPSLVKNTDSGKRHDKVMDSRKGSKSDGEKQSSGRITTRGVYHGTDDGYVHFYEQVNHDPSQWTGQLSPSRPAQSLPLLSYEMDIRDLPNERTRVYRDPSQWTGMVSTSRSVDNYVRQYQSDRALPQISGQLLPFRSAQSPSSLQHEIDITDLPNSGIKIEQQPKSKKQPEGSEVIFELKVQEQDKYSYQWLKDGAELEGKCDATLILDNVELREFGWYKCRVCPRENFGINCESSRAWLDVVPKVQNATRLKKFIEVDPSTCDSVALYLNKDLLPGVGGYRQAAAVFGMTSDMIGALETCKSPGQEIIEVLKATKPDITVYTVCKQLKDDKMRRFDIAKILENHLTITESEV